MTNHFGTPTSTLPMTLADFTIGRIFVSETYEVTADEIVEFATKYDPQFFHLDAEAAKQSFFKGLAASGWHVAGIAMRLFVHSVPVVGGMIGSRGEIAWLKPTRPGDLLQVESTVMDVKASRSRPGRGTITMSSITRNQYGDTVQTFTARIVIGETG